MGVAQTPRSVVLALLLFSLQNLGDSGRARLLCGLFLLREFGFSLLLFLMQAFIARFESPPRAFRTVATWSIFTPRRNLPVIAFPFST